ncbi:aerobic-type carbon monoxide dehydrogenase, middle subunit CoxM/CutM-like protein [Desulfocapsa sulfexigens DSM 10523]|uniref:Aerobic-type carbon monoxide dehydrogenase, middle subunit CoxM/CutM-like protein n=1 Tax=Desulfocapsa sulfexigens (strain DSM 10523 / SB164P1) TaxID=1167006 RepID=M1P875_DESSD|nr:xanthine dehydrogenase subunit XdhB [Desulfocapsa sulfexigens]AGF77877.1 aerobic-type carbon monoxide dehydrogenase, middle subunit CoxM/CutM-like protein [Desulfocapsa sulfexigens DSM 10523]
MFPIENYHFAESIKDAVEALAADEKARIIAGGTDVLVRLHGGNTDYGHLVDINGLRELKEITIDGEGNICIGSLATFTEIMEHELIQKYVPVIAESLATIGGPQVRNCGTMGGNICNGAVSADSACAALIHEFELVVESPEGERTESINGFHTGPGRTILQKGDLLKYFRIRPENYIGFSASYYKYAMRGAMDIATIGSGAAVKMNGDIIKTLKIAFTVAAPTPVRCRNAERAMENKTVSEENLQAMADAIEEDVRPRTSWRASREFRLHLIRTLAKRVVRQAVENQGGAL